MQIADRSIPQALAHFLSLSSSVITRRGVVRCSFSQRTHFIWLFLVSFFFTCYDAVVVCGVEKNAVVTE